MEERSTADADQASPAVSDRAAPRAQTDRPRLARTAPETPKTNPTVFTDWASI